MMLPLKYFWNIFSSVKLALFTLCALASTSIIGTIIPQGEPYNFYVQQFGAKAARFFDILDIADMYYSWWYLGLLAILSMNLIICSLDRLPRVIKIISRDNLAITPDRMAKMGLHKQWPISHGQFKKIDIQSLLKTMGWNLAVRPVDDNVIFFAQKNRWSRLGVYIVHLSIIIIFAGALIGHFWGFKGAVMIPELQSTAKIYAYDDSQPIDLGFIVRCNSFVIEFYRNGMPREFRSNLTIIEDNKEVLSTDIKVNDPLNHRGITFYQSNYEGYKSFILNVTDKQSGQRKQFMLPFQKQKSWAEKDIHFGIINAKTSGDHVVQVKIWFKLADNPPFSHWLNNNQNLPVKIGDRDFIISAKQMYATGLQVTKDPGVWLVYIGCGFLLIGLFMAFFLSHKRIWLYAGKNSDKIILHLAGSSNKNKLDFTRDFQELVSQLNKKLGH